jgi:hypothetical protein
MPLLVQYYLLPAFRHFLFRRTASHQLIQHCLSSFGAQYTAQTLNIFTLRTIAADYDCNTAIGHIHSLIQDATSDQFAILTRAETFQDSTPFLGGRLIGVM